MALPKRRHSITRGRRRRTHWKINATQTVVCPQCKQSKLPHHICQFCGYYNGREVIKIETIDERKRRREKKGKENQ
ncbi:MAG: 50S ribosomal protein L32 [Candidatus Omnitrophica bacterium]|nr:50S ribosomal protein L32 [Candidatus Omnitrophota bacterium]MDD5352707.1 50S ribosomal protein L32 [Candidatus Omnitrophota bacterium]MDD5550306.1 50S ribosomal protein L32 [Candidatus Omnitrophota bacterium]